MGCRPTLEVIMSQIPTANMLEGDIISREWECHGTTWTNNEQFDRDGYIVIENIWDPKELYSCLLYTSPSPRDLSTSRMPSSA